MSGEGANVWLADVQQLHWLQRARRRVIAALRLLQARLFPHPGRIRVPGVSAEWLTRHANESGRRRDE